MHVWLVKTGFLFVSGVSMTPNRSMGAASAATTATGGGGTSSVSNQGSVSTLTSIGEADSVGQLPSMPRPGSQASSASRTKNRQSYLDAVSYGSTGPPPPPNSNSAGEILWLIVKAEHISPVYEECQTKSAKVLALKKGPKPVADNVWHSP